MSMPSVRTNTAVCRRRRHLHGRGGVRRSDRRVAARQDAHHAGAARRRHRERRRQGRRGVSLGAAVPARHHGRDQHHPGAHRRALRAAHHAGLPRYLRDRPRQPAGILQSVLQAARAADRPRPALRNPRAHGRAGQGADPARRGGGARRGRAGGRRRARRPSPSCSCTPTAIRRTSSASRRSSRRLIRSCSSPHRTSCRRNTASSSAPRRRPPTPMWVRACGDYLGGDGRAPRRRRLRRRSS